MFFNWAVRSAGKRRSLIIVYWQVSFVTPSSTRIDFCPWHLFTAWWWLNSKVCKLKIYNSENEIKIDDIKYNYAIRKKGTHTHIFSSIKIFKVFSVVRERRQFCNWLYCAMLCWKVAERREDWKILIGRHDWLSRREHILLVIRNLDDDDACIKAENNIQHNIHATKTGYEVEVDITYTYITYIPNLHTFLLLLLLLKV